jgi:DNA mismatch repair protein MutL
VRDLFYNVPARRKFLRSEATESFHLTNLVTHYALAHPEIAFTLNNNGREVLRVAPATDLRERAYQVFGTEFLDNLLAVSGGHAQIARVSGFVSAPRDRRTSRDAQYLFVNGRFVRDRLVARALSEGYRAVLPHGVYPAALLFIELPLAEVDVNVHPAKTEVRFRRAPAVADAVREAVRAALASAGYVRADAKDQAVVDQPRDQLLDQTAEQIARSDLANTMSAAATAEPASQPRIDFATPDLSEPPASAGGYVFTGTAGVPPAEPRHSLDESLESAWPEGQSLSAHPAAEPQEQSALRPTELQGQSAARPTAQQGQWRASEQRGTGPTVRDGARLTGAEDLSEPPALAGGLATQLPPLNSAERFTKEVSVESLSTDIRPLGQLDESFIIATDNEGLLLIDQHVAHERILFDKYRALESERLADSQQLLIPETFDLTPAQASIFDTIAPELESYGFGLMRLSGRTVAIKAAPADLPAGEARNMLAELLDTVDAEKKGSARETLRDDIAASLACHAAIKVNMPLSPEKMRWLIDRLLQTSSPTTCPHGRPVILRLATRDILKGFHRI